MKPVCLITGGSGRLGIALAERLAPTHSIILAYNTQEPKSPTQLRRALGPGGEETEQGYAVQADLRNAQDQRRLVEVALARYGRIDVLINSAADTKFHGSLLDLAFAERAEIDQLDLNCVQPFRLTSVIHHQCWKHDPESNARMNCCVVNVSSVSGLYVYSGIGQAYYAASKAALNHLTRFLADEMKPYSVRANAICPARFPSYIATSYVVAAIVGLLASRETGAIVEVSRVAGSHA